ncbi:unnamed protein product [Prunus armeniaca]
MSLDHRKTVAHKQRPKGDAGCARNFLREVSRIDTQLLISSVIRETQGDNQSVLRETQLVKNVLRETQGAP